MLKLFRAFSFPGQLGSHCTPEVPGSIHEGGELGYSISHAFGAAFDNPDLIVSVVVGDGEAETGPLATAWHSNKFLNPIRDGAVLPILHLNGYKIANPTVLARIPHEDLDHLFRGYGWTPHTVEGNDPEQMHQEMAATVEICVEQIRAIQQEARSTGKPGLPRWPMIILRSPKGWTGPKEVDGHKVEDFWRAHQVPVLDVQTNPEHARIVEQWMRSYRPEELFDEHGYAGARTEGSAAQRPAPDERQSSCQRREVARTARSSEFLRLCSSDCQPRTEGGLTDGNPGQISVRRNAAKHDHLPRFQPGRKCVQSAAGHLRGKLEDLARRHQAGGRGRHLYRSRRARDGNAERTHTRRLARGISSDGTPRPIQHVRGIRPHHRLDVQPARQVAGEIERGNSLAGFHFLAEPVDHVGRLATGSQRLHPRGSRLPGSCQQQERGDHPHLPSSRRQLPAQRGGPLPAQPELCERDRRRQAAAPGLSRYECGNHSLHQRRRHLGLGQQ